jgi:hypothetical protein
LQEDDVAVKLNRAWQEDDVAVKLNRVADDWLIFAESWLAF